MPSPVEQNLHTLLPTTNLLPPQLVSIAGALLAQSKHAAPTLKTEEEIARTYTCCHIACERLANKLALDIGKINPPCGPRVYRKLHSYLEGTLTAGRTSKPATPRTKRTVDQSEKQTPSSIHRREQVKEKVTITPSKTHTPSAKRKRQDEPVSGEDMVPEYLAKLSQHLCRSLKISEAIPHVYAGLESVWPSLSIEQAPDDSRGEATSKRQRKLSAKAEALLTKNAKITLETGKVPLLVVTLFQSTFSKLRDAEVTRDEAEDIFGETIAFLREQDNALAETVYDESYEDIVLSIQSLGTQLESLPFWQSWYENIPHLSNGDENDWQTRDHDDGGDDDILLPRAMPSKTPLRRKEKHAQYASDEELPGPSGLLPGLGTMFQPAVDWLSDDRMADYAIWERKILKEIAVIEQKA